MSKTPIQAAVDALIQTGHTGNYGAMIRDARAVFESIDEEWLVRALQDAEDEMIEAVKRNLEAAIAGEPVDETASSRVYARAIKAALLTGGES